MLGGADAPRCAESMLEGPNLVSRELRGFKTRLLAHAGIDGRQLPPLSVLTLRAEECMSRAAKRRLSRATAFSIEASMVVSIEISARLLESGRPSMLDAERHGAVDSCWTRRT